MGKLIVPEDLGYWLDTRVYAGGIKMKLLITFIGITLFLLTLLGEGRK